MNRNSNSYTVIYATVLTVIVAVLLALAALGLKDQQKKNTDNEKKMQVLAAVASHLDRVPDLQNAGEIWASLNMDDNKFTVNPKGQVLEGVDPFEIDSKSQFSQGKVIDSAQLPVFKAVIGNKEYYILALYGNGLWDVISGYVSVEADGNTLAGATFDHKGETAGLGAKIKDDPAFAAQFAGKHLFKDGQFTSVAVLKKGKTSEGDKVDAITGATMTSNGVSDMIKNSLEGYLPFLQSLQNK